MLRSKDEVAASSSSEELDSMSSLGSLMFPLVEVRGEGCGVSSWSSSPTSILLLLLVLLLDDLWLARFSTGVLVGSAVDDVSGEGVGTVANTLFPDLVWMFELKALEILLSMSSVRLITESDRKRSEREG